MILRPSQAQYRAVHPVLQSLLIGYINPEDACIGPKLLPPIDTGGEQTGTIYTLGRGDFHGHRMNTLEWGLGAVPFQSPGFGTSEATYVCERFAEDAKIPSRAIARSQIPLDLKRLHMARVAEDMALAQERRIANAFFSTSNFSQNTTLVAPGQWTTSAGVAISTADPVSDIRTAIETVENNGRRANTIIFGRQAWYGFLRAPAVLEFLSLQKDRQVLTSEEARALLLGRFDTFKQVFVGHARQNTANPNQTVSLTDLWGDGVWVGHLAESSGSSMGNGQVAISPTAVARFVEQDWLADEFEDKPSECEVVRVQMSEDVVVTSAPDGYYIADTQAA